MYLIINQFKIIHPEFTTCSTGKIIPIFTRSSYYKNVLGRTIRIAVLQRQVQLPVSRIRSALYQFSIRNDMRVVFQTTVFRKDGYGFPEACPNRLTQYKYGKNPAVLSNTDKRHPPTLSIVTELYL